MARRFRLRSLPGTDDEVSESNPVIDRREFMRYSFNTAAGVITMASLGSIGFASLLWGLPTHPAATLPFASGCLQVLRTPFGTVTGTSSLCHTPLSSMPRPTVPQEW